MQTETEVAHISPDEMRVLLEGSGEGKYQVVDIRQPQEYKEAHIAGARLLPFPHLLAKMDELPKDCDLIFYCRNGKRSQAAALFAQTSGVFTKEIFNLAGGLEAWEGVTLTDYTDLRVFDLYGSLSDQLYRAMDLEKGAYRFYSGILQKYDTPPFLQPIEILADAEEEHARLIYSFWEKEQVSPQPFEELYESLPGDILEGGQSLAVMLDKLSAVDQDACVDIMEMALGIEYKAYELYSAMASLYSGSPMEEPFLTVAQAEKSHMRIAAEALKFCGEAEG